MRKFAKPCLPTLLAIAVAAGTSGIGLANPESPKGSWHGFIAVQSLPQKVSLRIATNEMVLNYSSPRNCEVKARYRVTNGQTYQFSKVKSTCAHAEQAAAIISVQQWGDVVEYELVNKSGGTPLEVGYLKRQ